MAISKQTSGTIRKRSAFQYVAIAFVAFIAVGMLASCSGNGGSSSSSSASESPSSSSQGVSVSEVKLSPTTEYLEYSAKEVDPLTLVSNVDSGIAVATDDRIDLSKVGAQRISYVLSDGEESVTQEVQFTVRDTKAPTIELSNPKPSIDRGGEFNASSSISKVSDPVDGDLPKVDSEPDSQSKKTGLEQFYGTGWFIVDGSVDSGTPGTYSLMVKASDKHGNVATKEILVTVNEVEQKAEEPASAAATYTYIANAKSGTFHVRDCRDVKKMKDSNKVEITATRQEMIDMGYKPCGHCNP